MKTELDVRMKEFEVFSKSCVENTIPFVIRLDGRSFSRMTEKHFRKPFDEMFSAVMDDVTDSLVSEFGCSVAFTQSDEISLLFPEECSLFNRRAEKLSSVTAGFASAKFSKKFTEIVVFDSRVIVPPTRADVAQYFKWRLIDGMRNSLNTCFYWELRNSGKTAKQASHELANSSPEEKKRILSSVWDDVSDRFRYGRLSLWETFSHVGTNPVTGEKCDTLRKRLTALTTHEQINSFWTKYSTPTVET